MSSTRTYYQRQRRQRGQARIQSHRNYLKHRSQNKMRAKQRYRRMRNNPAFKRRQKLYRMHPERYHRKMAGVEEYVKLLGIPFWSSTLGDGTVLTVDDDEVFVVMDGSYRVDPLYFQDFLDTATFLDDNDIERFFDAMDAAMGLSLSTCAVSDAMAKVLDGETGT